MKKYSVSLQVKTPVRFHLTSVRMAITKQMKSKRKKKKNPKYNKCKDVEKKETFTLLGGCKMTSAELLDDTVRI
jgi:hypothetical protein